ncbi:MAG: hypothetical protein J0647_02545 [Campylobacteraceae bacterium]|nr:hypothetical protein [Campylobacteraceae bacterium]
MMRNQSDNLKFTISTLNGLHVKKSSLSRFFKAFYENKAILSQEDLETYIADAKAKNIAWTIK